MVKDDLDLDALRKVYDRLVERRVKLIQQMAKAKGPPGATRLREFLNVQAAIEKLWALKEGQKTARIARTPPQGPKVLQG